MNLKKTQKIKILSIKKNISTDPKQVNQILLNENS